MEQNQTPAPRKGRYEKTLVEVAEAERKRLADDPNIVSIGYGLKFVGGKPQMRAALRRDLDAERAASLYIAMCAAICTALRAAPLRT